MTLKGVPLAGGVSDSIGDAASFGVVTVSDRAHDGVYEDASGPAIVLFFQEAIESPWTVHYRLVPDIQAEIESALKSLVSLLCARS